HFPAHIKTKSVEETSFRRIDKIPIFSVIYYKKEQKPPGKTELGEVDVSTVGPPPKSGEIHWLYIDNEKKVQGPFANSLMHKWHEDGHFDRSLLVRKYENEEQNKLLVRSDFCAISEIKNCDVVKDWQSFERLNWFYLDEDGNEQGPFSSKTMLKWVQRGFIPGDLQLRSDISTEYALISSFAKPFGEKCFLHDFSPGNAKMDLC
ncbi:GRB10 interacting GYF protein 1, partial [Bonamia ostreae]